MVVVVVVVTTVVCMAGGNANCARVVLGSTRGTPVEVALLIGLEALLPLLEGRLAVGWVGGSMPPFYRRRTVLWYDVAVGAGKHRARRAAEVASVSCAHSGCSVEIPPGR